MLYLSISSNSIKLSRLWISIVVCRLKISYFPINKSECFSEIVSYIVDKASGSRRSSASKKKTYSPCAISSPAFLAEEGPPFSLSIIIKLG